MRENKNPRICDVLGVAVDEEWRVSDSPCTYRVNSAGRVQYSDAPGRSWYSVATADFLLSLINGELAIKHQSRWSIADIADAKAIQRLFPDMQEVARAKYADCVYVTNCCSNSMKFLPNELFPSLHPGEYVKIAEILEAGRNAWADD